MKVAKVLQIDGLKKKVEIVGLYYPARRGEPDNALVMGLEGMGAPVLPMFSDAQKLEAFLGELPPVEHEVVRVEREGFLDAVDATARKRGEPLYLMVDPEPIAGRGFGGFCMLLGNESAAEPTVGHAVAPAPHPSATPYEADGFCHGSDARYMAVAKGVVVFFESQGVDLHPCLKSEQAAREKLTELGCPFEEIVKIRDPSALIRLLEPLLGHECRLCDGETMKGLGRKRGGKRSIKRGVACDHSAGARAPRVTGASSSAPCLRGKVFPTRGEAVVFVRLRGSEDWYLALFESAEQCVEYFARWPDPGGPDGAAEILDEAEFLLRFPQKLGGAGECRLIHRLGRAPNRALTFEVISWRD
jgi:hypothetical protein